MWRLAHAHETFRLFLVLHFLLESLVDDARPRDWGPTLVTDGVSLGIVAGIAKLLIFGSQPLYRVELGQRRSFALSRGHLAVDEDGVDGGNASISGDALQQVRWKDATWRGLKKQGHVILVPRI
jgi:hypothetical protein